MRVGITVVLGNHRTNFANKFIAACIKYCGLGNKDMSSEQLGDFDNLEDLREVIKGCNGVVQFAGASNSEVSSIDPNFCT